MKEITIKKTKYDFTNPIDVGSYDVFFKEKGKSETCLPIKEGQMFFTVRLDKTDFLDVETQAEAEIISTLSRIERLLKKRR